MPELKSDEDVVTRTYFFTKAQLRQVIAAWRVDAVMPTKTMSSIIAWPRAGVEASSATMTWEPKLNDYGKRLYKVVLTFEGRK